ncbi:hypothetical protein SEVIR_9G274200v4 [Setaria viridis]|uniref:Uncharacterized protein n=2 Tax=Setaria TaxID=4554 RepID=K4AKG3_SETIT|nr:uncharacterized protein LOC101781197 isoform X2 [Setaria italica]XP_034575937.1 uncharacterized protein LOC117839656 isoform X1 [Setaria viridis]RCV43166.1 hypothetical protein SETIT_9G273300v2 [Setaria italica]TKV94157.1 hypothetical protein SEVIR_9G274200v2 [Setaria viridis]
MGNCQTADAVAVVIQHPPGGGVGGGRVERAHGALSAAAVMAANPGHYVAAVIPGDDAAAAASRARKRRLKLLRPDDTLALGGVYRLVSFEEVLREFVSKRHATLSRRMVVATAAADAQRPESDRSLAQEQAQLPSPDQEATSSPPDPTANDLRPSDLEPDFSAALVMLGGRLGLARHGQWRPALPSIAEGSVAC